MSEEINAQSTVARYTEWFSAAKPGQRWTYAVGYLPVMRKANHEMDKLAELLWVQAGGWPTQPKGQVYLEMAFRKDKVSVVLVQRRIGYMHYVYYVVKL